MQTLTQAAACLALPLSSAPSGREISILDAFHLLWTYARSGKELSHLMRFTDTRCCTGTCGNQCPPPPQIHMQSMSETLEVEIALFLIIVKPEILEVIQLDVVYVDRRFAGLLVGCSLEAPRIRPNCCWRERRQLWLLLASIDPSLCLRT
jgi:hypothetical protein